MRKIILAFTMAVLALATGLTHATAADLGKPAPAPLVIPDPVKDQWNGMYFEFGAAGQFMKGEKNAAGLAGLGYNFHTFGNPLVVSAFLRYGFSAEGNSDAAVLTFDQRRLPRVTLDANLRPRRLLQEPRHRLSWSTDWRRHRSPRPRHAALEP